MTPESSESRLAVCSWSLRPKGPDDLVEKLLDVGLTRVQLALDPLVKDRAWAGAEAALTEAGVDIVSGMFGTKGEDYSTLETIKATGGIVPDSTWEDNWAHIRKVIPAAAALRVKLVSFHAGFLPEDPASPAYGKLEGRIARIAEAFADAGIDLAFETGQEDAPHPQGFPRPASTRPTWA